MIIDEDGIIDNFRGDSVLAFFNVPIKHEDYVERAVAVAHRMQAATHQVNEKFEQEDLLKVGMGVTAGMVYTSVVGSKDCKDYTVMGDTVNLCARLQDQAQAGEILVSEEVYGQVEEFYPNAKEKVLTAKGIKEQIRTYALTAGN